MRDIRVGGQDRFVAVDSSMRSNGNPLGLVVGQEIGATGSAGDLMGVNHFGMYAEILGLTL